MVVTRLACRSMATTLAFQWSYLPGSMGVVTSKVVSSTHLAWPVCSMMAMSVWNLSSFTVSTAKTGAHASTEAATSHPLSTMGANAVFMLTREALESEHPKVRRNAAGCAKQVRGDET